MHLLPNYFYHKNLPCFRHISVLRYCQPYPFIFLQFLCASLMLTCEMFLLNHIQAAPQYLFCLPHMWKLKQECVREFPNKQVLYYTLCITAHLWSTLAQCYLAQNSQWVSKSFLTFLEKFKENESSYAGSQPTANNPTRWDQCFWSFLFTTLIQDTSGYFERIFPPLQSKTADPSHSAPA